MSATDYDASTHYVFRQGRVWSSRRSWTREQWEKGIALTDAHFPPPSADFNLDVAGIGDTVDFWVAEVIDPSRRADDISPANSTSLTTCVISTTRLVDDVGHDSVRA
jgi:hypothetical protein